MEDPGGFDLWARVLRGAMRQAAPLLAEWRPELTPLALHRELNRSKVNSELILIARRLTWSQAQHFRQSPPSWACDIKLFQEDYGPGDWDEPNPYRNYCAVHRYYYGGSEGCHVCSGCYLH
jgi:hypothetical protein